MLFKFQINGNNETKMNVTQNFFFNEPARKCAHNARSRNKNILALKMHLNTYQICYNFYEIYNYNIIRIIDFVLHFSHFYNKYLYNHLHKYVSC